MKDFPNQIAVLDKLSTAVKTISNLLESKKNPKDDGVLGEALVRS